MSNEQDQTGQPKYVTEFNNDTGKMLRTETSTGKTWEWVPTPIPPKKDYTANNGVTVKSLTGAGHRVQTIHMRQALYRRQYPAYKQSASGQIRGKLTPIIVPSYFKNSQSYILLATGGYTYVTITSKDKKHVFNLTGECSNADQYCYKAGVKAALEKLSPSELADLLHGAPYKL